MNVLDQLYGILFHPIRTFSHVVDTPSSKLDSRLILALSIVLVVSLFNALSVSVHASQWVLFVLTPMNMAYSVFGWIVTGLIFATGCYAYTKRFDLVTLMILSAYAIFPWILMPVIFMWQWSVPGIIGSVLSFLGTFGLFLWTSFLFLLAVKKAYDLNIPRLIALGTLPFLMGLLGFAWLFNGMLNGLLRLN